MCSHLCQNILRFFWIKSNCDVYCICYCENTHDELSICCITFAYVYNKLFTFISLHNNWIVLLGNFFIIDICESYIIQCKLGVDVWIFTNIQ
jgi:hypothetical protein